MFFLGLWPFRQFFRRYFCLWSPVVAIVVAKLLKAWVALAFGAVAAKYFLVYGYFLFMEELPKLLVLCDSYGFVSSALESLGSFIFL